MLNKKNGLIASLLISTCLWASGALSSSTSIGFGGKQGVPGVALCCTCKDTSTMYWAPALKLSDVIGYTTEDLDQYCRSRQFSSGGCEQVRGTVFSNDCEFG